MKTTFEMSQRAILIALLVVVALTSNLVIGQTQSTCEGILRDGVFNLTTIDSRKTVQENLYEWLKTTEWEQFSNAQKSWLTIGFPIKGIPFNLSGSFSQDSFREWKREVDQGQIRNFSSDEFLKIVQRSVAPEIVSAWLECEKVFAGPGLFCSHALGGDSTVTFSFKWTPNSITDLPPVVTNYGFQVTGAQVPAGFGSGNEIPIGGASLILTRDSPTTPINIVLNTTKGSCTRYIPPSAKPPDPGLRLPDFILKTFTATSALAAHPEVSFTVPPEYKIISGGCRDNFTGVGNMLTACYPQDERTWVGRGKDHAISDPATLDIFVTAVYDPKNEWIVYLQSATSSASAVPTVTATLPQGYTLTGGGAFVTYSGWGQLLTASYPESVRSWTARAKQHMVDDSEAVTSISIGIQPRNGMEMPVPVIFSNRSNVASHPSTSVQVDAGYTMTGGGALADWRTEGSLLVSSFPSDTNTWTVKSKDHLRGEATSILGYGIGIKFLPKVCQFLVGPDRLTFASAAGSANLSVQAENGCGFSAVSGDYWIRLDPMGQLTSSTQLINVRVEENTTKSPRTGNIVIAGRSVTVVQESAPVCGPFTVRLSRSKFDLSGGSATAEIIGQAGCLWSAQSSSDFVSLSPRSSVGSGTINIFVSPNGNTVSRTAKLTLGGIDVQISQDGPPVCSGFSVRLSTDKFTASGGLATAQITSGQAGCPWNARSDSAFVTFSSASGQGSGQLQIIVAPNKTATELKALLTIAGVQLQITQSATTLTPQPPSPFYDFEVTTEGWQANGMIISLASSTAVSFKGNHALEIKFGGPSYSSRSQVYVSASGIQPGRTVNFHVWIPKNSPITAVNAYTTDRYSNWTGNWIAASKLTPNSWSTLQVTVPTNAATPLSRIGLEFSADKLFKGVVYIDAIGL